MIPRLLPPDLSAEELLLYLPEDSYTISIDGSHKRNSCMDIMEIEENPNGKNSIHIARNGLYDSLPEFLFHPVNRFDNLPEQDKRERFADECRKQEQETNNARRFFQPIDILLTDLRISIKRSIDQLISNNKILIDILSDNLSQELKNNRFVRHTLNFLPKCREIRGNSTLLTFMLRKIFLEESLFIEKQTSEVELTDEVPRYNDSIGSNLSELYAGNTYNEKVLTYTIHHWPENDCDSEFPSFINELEAFTQFINDFFISVEERLVFDISNDEPPLRLSDTTVYNYLNYNANI